MSLLCRISHYERCEQKKKTETTHIKTRTGTALEGIKDYTHLNNSSDFQLSFREILGGIPEFWGHDPEVPTAFGGQ